MTQYLELITCPEINCGQLAEITRRDILDSTDGPILHIGTLCINKHVLFMPEEQVEV